MTAFRQGIVALTWDAQGACRFCDESDIARRLVHADPVAIAEGVRLDPSSGWGFEGMGPRSFGEFDGLDCAEICLAAWSDEGRVAHAFFA